MHTSITSQFTYANIDISAGQVLAGDITKPT